MNKLYAHRHHGIPRRDFIKIIGISAAGVSLGANQIMGIEGMKDDTATKFYVATGGNDYNPGTLEQPFATLQRARDAIRQLKSESGGNLPAPVKVLVRGGKYFLDETLILEAGDSGTREHPVVYTTYPGEKPVISGGRRITGWQPYKDKIMQCPVSEAQGGNWRFTQLFFNGKRQVRSRWPNDGWLTVEGPAEPESFTSFRYKDEAFPRTWAKPTQGDVFMKMQWGFTTITPIRKMDIQNQSITMAQGVRNFERPPWIYPNKPGSLYSHFGFMSHYFFVENLLEELDLPGEWCLDTDEGKVYFWPPEETLLESSETVVPLLDCLISLRGASWVIISGFTLTEVANAGDNMHRFGYQGTGAMFPMEGRTYCGEAIHLAGTEYCQIVDNTFDSVGGNAIYLEGYNLKNKIKWNEITNSGHCGIGLIGKVEYEGKVQHPLCNEITDNYIHHCGIFNKVATGIFCGVSDGNVIGHNLIEQVPHHAINLGNHGYGRNIVEFNDIRDTCQETYDNGAINCWMENENETGQMHQDGERAGHIIRYNRVSGHPGLGFCIYIDNFSSNCLIYGNILLLKEHKGIRINGGKNNFIENNIFIGVGEAMSFMDLGAQRWKRRYPEMKGFMTANRFCRNIVCGEYNTKEPLIFNIMTDVEDADRVLGDSDNNIFFDIAEGGRKIVSCPSGKLSFEQWKSVGYDQNSLVADPLFLAPELGDYRLKPGSPALKLGFNPILFDQIGVRGSGKTGSFSLID